jgi:RimJ/RimL family protein N-acetyltransferase
MRVPPLETPRLIIRPFILDDLEAIHRILDVELRDADFGSDAAKSLDERRQWLQWTTMGYEQLAQLHQPPYGDRAIVLRQPNRVIGACGFVPCLNPFEQLPSLARRGPSGPGGRTSTEFGLFYAIAPAHQRRGYAAEAAAAMVDYAFSTLHLGRVIATTTRNNVASIGVMRRLGMRIEENPYPDPPWLQVVGILDNREPL